MSKVSIVKCTDYDYDNVKNAVKRGIELLGGADLFAKPNEKILLKPNILAADPPSKCTTTHHSVFKAVAEIFKQTGANISYGDSPAFHKPDIAAKKALLHDAAESLGIPLADFVSGREILFKDGVQNKKFTLANAVLETDGLISIPKLKTHGFAKMTGCIKNQFGCIPGTLKGEFHVRVPNILDFSRMLVDLNNFIKPRLFIMDGITAMEGNGPRGGTPRQMNVLLFSSDPIALDATVCRIIDLNPELVPTIIYGKEVGLGTYLESDIEIVGDPIEAFITRDFNVKKVPLKPYKEKGITYILKNILVPKPHINEEKCVKCGVCVQMCPVNPKAVDWHTGSRTVPPSYKYKRCIRCFCCQELCPESAISIKVPILRKIFDTSYTKRQNQ